MLAKSGYSRFRLTHWGRRRSFSNLPVVGDIKSSKKRTHKYIKRKNMVKVYKIYRARSIANCFTEIVVGSLIGFSGIIIALLFTT